MPGPAMSTSMVASRPLRRTQAYVRQINGYFDAYVGTITGVDMTGSLSGTDGASAAWGKLG